MAHDQCRQPLELTTFPPSQSRSKTNSSSRLLPINKVHTCSHKQPRIKSTKIANKCLFIIQKYYCRCLIALWQPFDKPWHDFVLSSFQFFFSFNPQRKTKHPQPYARFVPKTTNLDRLLRWILHRIIYSYPRSFPSAWINQHGVV